MNNFFAMLLLVVVGMFSANAMANPMADAEFEVSSDGQTRIIKPDVVWKDTGVVISPEAAQYPPELIFSAVNTPGQVIAVERYTRSIPKKFHLTTENVVKVGLLYEKGNVVVIHDKVVNSKAKVDPFYYLVAIACSLLILAVVLSHFTVAAFAVFAVFATFVVTVATATATAAATATATAAVATAAFATAATAAVGLIAMRKLTIWAIALLAVSAVCMYFGV